MKRSFGFTEEQLRNKISDFECDLLCRGKGPHKDQQDYMGHLCDWLSKNRLKTQQSSKPIKRQSNNAISKRQQELEARIRTRKRVRDAAFFFIIMLVTFAATLLKPQKYVSSRTIQKCVEHVSTST